MKAGQPVMLKRLTISVAAAALLGVAALAVESPDAAKAASDMAPAGQSSAGQQWPYFGGTTSFDRYSPLSQIDASNFKHLSILWSRPAVDKSILDQFPDLSPSHYLRSTPIMIDGVLYAADGVGLVEAFDAGTGKTIWLQKPFAPTLKEAAGQSTRGVAAWKGDGGMRIISVRGQYLYALDAKDGSLIASFGDGGRVSLNRNTPDKAPFFGWNGPIVIGDVIVVGGNGGGLEEGGYGDGGNSVFARPENIRAYDVRTGKQLWAFHLIPPGAEGEKNWGNAMWYTGNMAAWAPLTADPETGYVYVPTSAPTNSYYGGHRPGNNLYANSIICIDSKTGKEVWHFQLVHHDLWDYDTASAPVLADLHVDGKPVKAVIVTNKTGLVFVFDRLTGKPVWPIVERPVPQSTVPGEHTSPTQPFPTKLKPAARQGLNDDDLIDFTPELHKKAEAILDQYVTGPLFTPPSVVGEGPGAKKGTLELPGDWGGPNWNTGAFDPETGYYYATSMTLPEAFPLHKATNPEDSIAYMEGSDTPPPPGERAHRKVNPYGIGPDGDLPLTKPPYGRITAYDMNTGEQMWVVANGDGPRNTPELKALHLPPLGNPNRSVALITKTLLLAADTGDAVMGGFGVGGLGQFRAFNKRTGKEVGSLPLPAGATSGPMTYEADGKQMIVVAIGSKDHDPGWVALGLK